MILLTEWYNWVYRFVHKLRPCEVALVNSVPIIMLLEKLELCKIFSFQFN